MTRCQDELDVKTKKVNESVQKDISEVKEQGGLNKEEIVKLRTEVHTAREDMTRCQDELDVKTKKEQGGLNKEEIVKLRTEVHTAREDMTRCQDELDAKTKTINESVQKDISDVKKQGECSKEEIAKLDTEVSEVKEEISMILNTVENFNTQLNERDDLRGAIHHISEDVEYVRHGVQSVAMELTTTKSQVAELEIGFTSGQNDDDIDKLFTAPSRLTAFTGRESALEWLEQNLVSDQSPEDCPRMSYSCCTKAICGLGGCGKTSLAVEFAWRCTSNFPGGVFWINGESDENIRKSVAENLALVNNPASTSESIDDILNTFLALLSKKKLPWLLLLDNTDELQDPTCPTGVKKICKGPWQRNGNASKLGHILFTTRQNAKDTKTFLKLSSDDCLELQCFSEEEGALFLMQRTGSKGDSLDTEAISLLVNELGALPLALEQAAAYISALPIPCSFKAYLDKYLAVKLRLLKQQSATALSVEAQHRLSVHTTWEINFEFVTEKSPAAAAMMRIAAFLESENIPIDVINSGFPKLDQVELRDAANSEIDIAAILKVLTSYSLFSVDQHRRVFSVHKLVQEVVRDSLTISARTEALVAATRVLHFAFLENREPCSQLAKYLQSRNLSATKDEDRNILVALLLNFCKLKKHLEDELTMPKGNSIDVLFNDDTSKLCSFVCDLCKNNISLYRLASDLTDFNLRVLRMVHAEDDPNLLLLRMLDTSISKRNCSSPEITKMRRNYPKVLCRSWLS
ncbi:hypothetical protein OS493_006283 [Desmophyllum pertusum]|uniref:DUF7779 domain-containing protein n=1 Tax=Desmophyllum pertusum TaxID=174260 RepID=A0A9X0DC37_9CNID|nr:hypothetical protein OS493_006283 [Desmophyllum pertusum]